jgi:hypothetical protein
MNKYMITNSIKGIKHIYFQKKNFYDKQQNMSTSNNIFLSTMKMLITNTITGFCYGVGSTIGICTVLTYYNVILNISEHKK